MIRLVLTLVAMSACLALAKPAHSEGVIHLITVADTNDGQIGDGAKNNSKKMLTYLQVVATTLSVSDVEHGTQVVGDEFTNDNDDCVKIRAALSAFTAAADDVVVFYYSGHGFNAGTADKFPRFWCSDVGDHKFGLSVAALEIAKKGPRLVIAIADACDSLPGQSPPSAAGAPGAKPDQRPLLKKLFFGYKGSLLLAGASVREFSWYLPSGGLFSAQLFRALDAATMPGHTNGWQDVIAGATDPIRIRNIAGQVIVTQHPQANATKLSLVQAIAKVAPAGK